MKIVFFQKHIGFWLGILLEYILASLGIFAIVLAILTQRVNVFVIIICSLWTIVWLVASISPIYYHVKFLDDSIFISGELFGDGKTQFKDQIFYKEIKGLSFICANKNSKKQSLNISATSSLRPRLFLEFLLNDGTTKWMYVSYFSKKQRKQMLQLINSKIDVKFSYENLLKQKSQYFFRKKKQSM